MSKLRTDQLETLDGLHTKNVETLIDDINGGIVTTSTGEQALADALDNRVIYVGTIADLQALPTSGLVDGQQVHVKEYHAGTSVGGGEFYWDINSEEAQNGVTVLDVPGTAVGRWKRILGNVLSLDDAGIAFDGSDVTSELQNFFSLASTLGAKVAAHEGGTYTVSDRVDIANTKFDMNGATVIFAASGAKHLFYLGSDVKISNGAFEQNGNAGGEPVQGFQTCIRGDDAHNVVLDRLSFSGSFANVAAVGFYGDCVNHVVSNITFPGQVPFGQGIIYHWLCEDGTVDAGPENRTVHPHNIEIFNVKAKDFIYDGPLVSVVFISGCYNVSIRNVTAENPQRLASIIAGDFANEFSLASQAALVGSSITLSDCSARNCVKRGIHVEGSGVFTSLTIPMDVKIENPRIRSGGTEQDGIVIASCSGVKVVGGRINGFRYGVLFGQGCKGGIVDGVTIHDAFRRGIISDGGSGDNSSIKITNCRIYNNNIEGATSLLNSGIVLIRTKGCVITSCIFGQEGLPEVQRSSVYILGTCNDVHINSCHTFASATANAYVGENNSPYSMDLWQCNATSDTTNTTAGHVFYSAEGFGNRFFTFDGSTGSPTTGTWKQGDRFVYRTPVTPGWIGRVCISGGTPGTWANYGTVG